MNLEKLTDEDLLVALDVPEYLRHYERELFRSCKVMRELCEAAKAKRDAQAAYIDTTLGDTGFDQVCHRYEMALDNYRAMDGKG